MAEDEAFAAEPPILAAARAGSVALQHTDSSGLLALMQASKACRDWVLCSAPKASLLLELSSAEPYTAWVRRLAALRQCLDTRGPGLPLTLSIACGEQVPTGVLLALIIEHLGPACGGVTELVFYPTADDPDLQAATFFVQSMAAAMPRLRRLELEACATLPPPTALPSLTEACVNVAEGQEQAAVAALCSSVGACITQLTTLQVYSDGPNAAPYASLFPTTTYTLTHLDLDNQSLDNQLLSLLLDRAPELTHLGVNGCQLFTTHQGRQWKVESLDLLCFGQFIEPLARLPTCSTGPVMVLVGRGQDHLQPLSWILRADDNGLPAAFHGRLSEWRFSVSKVSFDIKRLDLLDQAPTLAPLMSQLQNLQAPGAVVELHGHEWTNEALQAVRAGLTTLPHLQFSLRLGVLGDSVLHELLACGESLVSVSVVGCRLQTDEHASVEWRWGELCVRHISTSEMLRLPLPRARDGVAPVLKCSSFQVDRITDQASQARIERWLGQVRWATEDSTRPVRVDIYNSDQNGRTGSADDLRARFSVLNKMVRADMQTQYGGPRVQLHYWPMTHDIVCAIDYLPHMVRHVGFFDCKWPQKPVAYQALAECLPESLHGLQLNNAPRKVVQSICTALAERRQRSTGLPPLQLQTNEHFRQGYFGPQVVTSHSGPNDYE